MKLKKMKKGFTIVELVIVIAVIGVLTAILVPTFINLTAKANKASDDSLVKNLNTALKMEESEQGAKNPTMHDAVLDLENEGYKLSQLVTKSKKDLLWNMETNQFELEEGQTGPNYWKICHNLPTDSKGFSVYAADDWSGAKEITVHSGFDAGYRSDFTSISYTRESTDPAQEVVIRTNGGTLTINAEKDIVNHYSNGRLLDVKAIAKLSYHEYGYFPKASIAQGRIVVENTGAIPSFEISAIPTAENPIQIETKNDVVVSATPEVVAALGDNKLDNVDVKVSSSNANVVIDEKIETANVEINGQPATEEDVISITKVSDLDELQSALEDEKQYIMFIDDIDANAFTNIVHSVTIDGNGHTISGTGGIRTGSTYDVLAINWQQTNNPIDVSIKNLTAINTRTTKTGGSRVVETRAGGLKSLEISNCHFESKQVANDGNALCLGGATTDSLELNISDSEFISQTSGYACLIWVPINAKINNSYFEGYSGLYFKSGTENSVVELNNSTVSAPNVHSGQTNSFGAIVFEDKSIRVTLIDSSINVTGPGQSTQTGILFNCYWGEVENAGVYFKGECEVNGLISSAYGDPTNFVSIEGGTYTFDPSDYVAPGHYVKTDGSFFIVL